MKVSLQPIEDQVLVIMGASSGIGLTAARMAARRGARVVLAARNEEALRQATDEINAAGGEAIFVVADVSREEDVRRIADAALSRFGRFDTWVNNAGVFLVATIEQTAEEDARRLFDTNFWGMVYGSRVALEHLRVRGGALINVGSVDSDIAIPLQGIYSASKHAVRGFTDALRMELEKEGAPVSVTLIKPSSIDTPLTIHEKTYTGRESKLPPPVYSPDIVADAILHCAEHPRRDMFVGGGGKAMALLGAFAPRVLDKVMEWTMFSLQHRSDSIPTKTNLNRPTTGGQERGDYPGHVRQTSLYTKAMEHPVLSFAAMVGAGLLLASMVGEERS